MSHSNLSNLHPVWRKALGLQEPAVAQPLDATSPWARSDLAQAIAVMTATSTHTPGAHHGWQATNRPHRPGAPLGIKDLFCTEGVESTAASKILRGFNDTVRNLCHYRIKRQDHKGQ